MKSLHELVMSELFAVQTAFQSLLDYDHNNIDLGQINASLNDLQALLCCSLKDSPQPIARQLFKPWQRGKVL